MHERDTKPGFSDALRRQALWSVSGLVALLIVVGVLVTMLRPESADRMWSLLTPIISMAIGGILVVESSAKTQK